MTMGEFMHDQDHHCPRHGVGGETSTCGSRRFLTRWLVGNSTAAGVFALLWIVFRSGPKPSRLAYPCQQAALASAGLALGAPLAAAVVAAWGGLVSSMRRPARVIAVVLGVIAATSVWGHVEPVDAFQGQRLEAPSDYRAKVFHVTGCPQQPEGDRFPGLDRLLELMGRYGLKLYRSSEYSILGSPEGIIGVDDVVIRAIVDHPDGFTGEIVVGGNTQWAYDERFDRSSNNSQDLGQSPLDVVSDFSDLGYRVSVSSWRQIRYLSVDEFSDGDYSDGYVVLDYDPDFRGRVSYPKFTSEFGTAISLRDGIWDPASERYDRDRLKFINLPVLKPHWCQQTSCYGATACVKNYMGVVTAELNTRSHFAIEEGILGAVMSEIGPADLNILDCVWTSYSPVWGPMVYYDGPVARTDQLVASTDPIAADMWAVRNILVPAFELDGFPPEPLPRPSADPDDPESAFRIYLDNSMQQLLEGGYAVTNDFDAIDVISTDASGSPRASRRPLRRGRPDG
jgi:hypothetical protein